MYPHHRKRGKKLRVRFREKGSVLALELAQTHDGTAHSAAAFARAAGSAATSASSRSSSRQTGRCSASAEVNGRHGIRAEFQEGRSG